LTPAALERTALAGCRGVGVTFGHGKARVEALREVDLSIAPEDTVALWGRSGSGKTTLLHVLGGLVAATEGSVTWRGTPLSSLDAVARARERARGIAYVFQGANLLPHFTAHENVAFAHRTARLAHGGSASQGLGPEELLGLVGLAGKGPSLPSELSGGEAQRVAIARALAQRPELLLCDEPTGQLDSDTGERVLDLIEALKQELGFALVLATHDADVASRLGRLVELRDGRLATVEDGR
jgi:ABC-type lipoprotein export system ATPase subunit